MTLTAIAFDLPAPPPCRKPAVALALSALLHGLLLLAWAGMPLPDLPQGESAMEVELAVQRPSPPPAGDAAAAPTPPPQPEVRQIPQLQDGQLGEQASPASAKPAMAPPSPRTVLADKPAKPQPVTQNERDVVLSQVLKGWKPPRELAAYDNADIFVGVTIGPDGYFTEEFDARRKWNPAEVFDDYARLHPQDIQRRTVDAFYRAIREAQPIRLPPALKAKAPFRVRLDFRLKDAPR